MALNSAVRERWRKVRWDVDSIAIRSLHKFSKGQRIDFLHLLMDDKGREDVLEVLENTGATGAVQPPK